MPESIVTYTLAGERNDAEKCFPTLQEAVRFADGVIEDRGSADVATNEVDDFSAFRYSLCEIYYFGN